MLEIKDDCGTILLAAEADASSQGSLAGKYLRRAQLEGAQLHGRNFRDADLSETDTRGFSLNGVADLCGIRAVRANLSGCILSRKDLSGAQFEGADLSRTRFENCNLDGATFSESSLAGAIIDHCTLR